MGVVAGGGRVDVFVSYAGPDRPWANWAAQQLTRAGMSVELTAWDWSAGDNFVLRMNDALGRADCVLALYSMAYFARDRFTNDEWAAVLAEPPDGQGRRRLVPVRVEKVTPPPILRAVTYRDVFGVPEQRARLVLLEAVTGRRRPAGDARFPGVASGASDGGVRVPGSLPEVWNVRRRNPAFTGRGRELAELRERLCSGERALVQALHGIGGVGKTELAVEYAHLFGNEYNCVWWIDAERPELVGEQLVALAVAAGWVPMDALAAVTRDTVLHRLQRESGWLLIYDNAETVDAIAALIPDGNGHVVITSRSQQSGGVAASPISIDLLDQAASSRLVRELAPTLPAADADRLAAAVNGLPLALRQAAGLTAETGMSVDEYLNELAANPAELLGEGPTGRYPQSLAAVVTASMRHLSGQDEAAGQLMRLVAVLAPEPVLLSWLTGTPDGTLPQPLATVVASTIARRRMLGRIAAYGLARVDTDTLQVHRLTQAVIAPTATSLETEHADRLLTVAAPGDERDPHLWPGWAALLPHLLIRAPITASPALQTAAAHALYYLLQRGEHRTVQILATSWHQQWQRTTGPDEPVVLDAANQIANSLSMLGEYEQSRRLNEDILARRQRVLGDDHPDTVRTAGCLAISLHDLGEYEQARRLHEDTLTRMQRVFGGDHPDTLLMTDHLAQSLHMLGDYEQACRLHEDTLTRQQQVLGDDHPDTLFTAGNLAQSLHMLGEYERARRLYADALTRQQRVLGDDHPETLLTAGNLAQSLHALGDYEQARRLHKDTLTRQQRVLGDDHPDTLRTADNLQTLGDHE
ncbi:FxSxx-COOH system tetratricopeptide repeat protein [Paractinoplanes lichenicola]|uniref:Toll/interleukin-1 receptor domain-containing protein n=1 Tax=Paractinoplanes lichenicola TaxID=2802976 RepID=A0ABS1W3N7_9ACTN|nr:FxSxx-COOH system tetratricopeptide repeat protein [Actinoplanes lichenicola]MBL7261349.1 toll/interleukin-1 receptor domain-containing protein [Actinoplanes lichenicola]